MVASWKRTAFLPFWHGWACALPDQSQGPAARGRIRLPQCCLGPRGRCGGPARELRLQ